MRRHSKKPPKSQAKNNKKKSNNFDPNSEVVLLWVNRLHIYQNDLNQIRTMGLPILVAQMQDQVALQELKKKPTSRALIKKFISIKIEGAPKNYHRIKLGMICMKYLKELLGFEPLDIDRLVIMIDEISEVKHTSLIDQKTTHDFGDDYLKIINPQGKFMRRYTSTSLNGYYEVKDPALLSIYGEGFEETRKLRILVVNQHIQYEKVIEAIIGRNIDKIDQELLHLLNLQKNLQNFCQVIPDNEEFAPQLVEKHLIGIEKYLKHKEDSKDKDKDKEVTYKQQENKNWNQKQQEDFEFIISKVKNISLEEIKVEDDDESANKKEKEKSNARIVNFSVFDSRKVLNQYPMKKSFKANFKNPFHICNFYYNYIQDPQINYEQDSIEEMESLFGEDLTNINESSESEESMESLVDFIEPDQEQSSCRQFQQIKQYEVKTNYIYKPQYIISDIQELEQFRVIKISDEQPRFKDTQENDSKQKSVIELMDFIKGRRCSRQKLSEEFKKIHPECSSYFIEKQIRSKCYKSNNEWLIRPDVERVNFLQKGVNLFAIN